MHKESSRVEIVGFEHLHLHTDVWPPVDFLSGAKKLFNFRRLWDGRRICHASAAHKSEVLDDFGSRYVGGSPSADQSLRQNK